MSLETVQKIRFAVGTPDAVLSSFWFVTVSNLGCIYVGARSLGGTLKASLHKDGNCHLRFGPSGSLGSLANSYVTKWKRRATPEAGVLHAGSILFSAELLRGKTPSPEGKALHVLLRPVPQGFAVELGMFYSRESPAKTEERFLAVGKPLIYSELATGEFFSVVARMAPFNVASIPQLSNLAQGQAQTYPPATWTSEDFKPGMTAENSAMLLFNDPQKDGLLRVIEVTGIRVTHNAPGA